MHSTKRVFESPDQREFALLSGDHNPIHLDAISARRTQAGATVVHGIHELLWALETAANVKAPAQLIARVVATFPNFLYVGAEANLSLVQPDSQSRRAVVSSDGVITARVTISYGNLRRAQQQLCADAIVDPPASPLVLQLEDIRGQRGALRPLCIKDVETTFPHAASKIGATRVGALAQLSTIVGMFCPGLHSLFSELDILFDDSVSLPLHFRVTDCDERFGRVSIAVNGGGLQGTLTAFARGAPVSQPTVLEIQPLVSPLEFAGVRALVVGGSRGLGALTARIIAAGGGKVTVTYLLGEFEANEIVEEIGTERAIAVRFNSRAPAASQLRGVASDFNQFYYFAASKIFRPNSGAFSASRFHEYCEFFVDGFADILDVLAERSARGLTAFYPSTVAIDDLTLNLSEYLMAKAAGESLSRYINKHSSNKRVLVRRLPRMLTDQTNTLMMPETPDPISIMLPIVREMVSLSQRFDNT